MSDSTNQSSGYEEAIDHSVRAVGGFVGQAIVFCKVCNKPFVKGKTRLGLCSKNCRQKSSHRKKNGQPIADIKTANCTVCAGVFNPSNQGNKICSLKCKSRAQKRRRAGNPMADQQYKRQCPVCYKIFNANRSDKKYCSGKCGRYASSRRMRGKPEGNILTATCVYCGVSFKPSSAAFRYCSADCYNQAQKLHKAGIALPYKANPIRHEG